MQATPVRLADGRELIYYDESPGTARAGTDSRQLAAFSATSTVRRDPLLDQWVIVAGHRQERTHLPSAGECPLCPSREDHLTEIPATDYQVVVFENRFPALAGPEAPVVTPSHDLFVEAPGSGRCEVICFTSEHDSSFASLTPSRARLVLEVWADRTRELSARQGVAQVFCFENRGPEIGVTEPHPHGQIYAYPFVTPRTRRMIEVASRYRQETGRRLVNDLMAAERDGPRVVARTEHWTAFVPFAARWPYEVHIYPRQIVPDLPSLTDRERDDFASLYLDLLGRFDRLFDQPAPYVSAWHQAPVNEARDLLSLHLELFTSRRAVGKLKYLAGSESAMDVFVGDIVPEDAAVRLRGLG